MATQEKAESVGFPTYAGIEDVTRQGMPVRQCAGYLARLAAIRRQSALIAAAHTTGVTNWNLKAVLALWTWEDAMAWRDLEIRLHELRAHRSEIGKVLQFELGDFLTEVLHAPGQYELCVGLIEVICPALIAAIDNYTARTQPLVDQPTIRLLEMQKTELMRRQQLGLGFLRAFENENQTLAAQGQEWSRHLQVFLEWAGGVMGEGTRPSVRPTPRAKEEFRICREFRRDPAIKTVLPKVIPAQFRNDPLKLMMWVRSQEMTGVELMASIIYEWEELPTEAVVDLARHSWDEARHALFGQAALEAEGHPVASYESWVGYAHHTLPAPPPKRYSHLAIAIEGGAMAYPGGKRGEWEFCRDEAKHPLMTTFQDFDWADEITHVNFGRKWLVEHFCGGDREKARQMADETMAEREAYYRQFDTPKLGTRYHGGY